MEQPPIITVIILCYNQQAYVKQAIASVYSQKNIDIQVIVCDDFSTDSSKQTIRSLKQIYDFELVENESNLGNCKSFNNCLSLVKGKYVIDLAADDYLIENSLSYRIKHFEKQGDDVGFTYSDAVYVKLDGHFLFDHSIHCGLLTFPEGAIFQRLFEEKFICPPTVIFKTNVLRGF
jgi:glycosyltransferase involved in cell wall biosynthesis